MKDYRSISGWSYWDMVQATGDMTGVNRPVGRVTVAENYQLYIQTNKGYYRSILSGQSPDWGATYDSTEREVPNVMAIEISRSIGQDAGTCRITIANDYMTAQTWGPEGVDTGIGRPGYFTFNRGDKPSSAINRPFLGFYFEEDVPVDYQYPQNEWYNTFIPNRLVRTYQGYGSDNFDDRGQPQDPASPGYVKPALDTRLTMTGTWLIDKITYNSNGTMDLECRDLSKLLQEQFIFPDFGDPTSHVPMIPITRYPLIYCPSPLPPGETAPPTSEQITDWSEAVKELLAWAGFTWFDWIYGTERFPGPTYGEPIIGEYHELGGYVRVWGDIGRFTGLKWCTTGQWFVNKSFMEAINLIRQALGAIFFIDEWGGAVFRTPNVFSYGNFVMNPEVGRGNWPIYLNEHPIAFHDNVNIIDYNVTIDDSAVRSQVIVTGTHPDVHSANILSSAVTLTDPASAVNFRNVLSGQQRAFMVPSEDSEGFKTQAECDMMAELTAMFILFSYRKGSLRAPCHPGLQIDDQIHIFERVTNEFFTHYVSGITTNQDLVNGNYEMTLTTHWLGEDPSTPLWFTKMVHLDAAKALHDIQQALGGTT